MFRLVRGAGRLGLPVLGDECRISGCGGTGV